MKQSRKTAEDSLESMKKAARIANIIVTVCASLEGAAILLAWIISNSESLVFRICVAAICACIPVFVISFFVHEALKKRVQVLSAEALPTTDKKGAKQKNAPTGDVLEITRKHREQLQQKNQAAGDATPPESPAANEAQRRNDKGGADSVGSSGSAEKSAVPQKAAAGTMSASELFNKFVGHGIVEYGGKDFDEEALDKLTLDELIFVYNQIDVYMGMMQGIDPQKAASYKAFLKSKIDARREGGAPAGSRSGAESTANAGQPQEASGVLYEAEEYKTNLPMENLIDSFLSVYHFLTRPIRRASELTLDKYALDGVIHITADPSCTGRLIKAASSRYGGEFTAYRMQLRVFLEDLCWNDIKAIVIYGASGEPKVIAKKEADSISDEIHIFNVLCSTVRGHYTKEEAYEKLKDSSLVFIGTLPQATNGVIKAGQEFAASTIEVEDNGKKVTALRCFANEYSANQYGGKGKNLVRMTLSQIKAFFGGPIIIEPHRDNWILL